MIMEEIICELNGSEFIELNSMLKLKNLANSGGEAKIRILHGEALVNGEVEVRVRRKLRANDVVEFDGHVIRIR